MVVGYGYNHPKKTTLRGWKNLLKSIHIWWSKQDIIIVLGDFHRDDKWSDPRSFRFFNGSLFEGSPNLFFSPTRKCGGWFFFKLEMTFMSSPKCPPPMQVKRYGFVISPLFWISVSFPQENLHPFKGVTHFFGPNLKFRFSGWITIGTQWMSYIFTYKNT